MDKRTIKAPYGVISGADLDVLLNGMVPQRTTKKGKVIKAHTLGRNAIRFYLFLLTKASGRTPGKKGYQLSQTEIEENLSMNKSSIYEALNDLLCLGLLVPYGDPNKKLFCLNTPKKSESSEKIHSESSDQNTPKQSETSDHNHNSTYGTNNHNTYPLPLTGEFEETVRKIITEKPYLLFDRKFGHSNLQKREDDISQLLKGNAEYIVNRLCLGSERSLLRSWGYEGSLRKRELTRRLRAFLECSTLSDFDPPKKESSIHPWVDKAYRWLVQKNHGLDGWDISQSNWVIEQIHLGVEMLIPPKLLDLTPLEHLPPENISVLQYIYTDAIGGSTNPQSDSYKQFFHHR